MRALGLIVQDPSRWVAYALTDAGRAFLKATECIATGLGSVL